MSTSSFPILNPRPGIVRVTTPSPKNLQSRTLRRPVGTCSAQKCHPMAFSRPYYGGFDSGLIQTQLSRPGATELAPRTEFLRPTALEGPRSALQGPQHQTGHGPVGTLQGVQRQPAGEIQRLYRPGDRPPRRGRRHLDSSGIGKLRERRLRQPRPPHRLLSRRVPQTREAPIGQWALLPVQALWAPDPGVRPDPAARQQSPLCGGPLGADREQGPGPGQLPRRQAELPTGVLRHPQVHLPPLPQLFRGRGQGPDRRAAPVGD